MEQAKAISEKVNWEEIARQMDKTPSQCYNKYVELSEKEWTEAEKQTTLDFWKENSANFKVEDLMAKLPGHTRRGILFRLERLTRDSGLPPYKISREEMQSYE